MSVPTKRAKYNFNGTMPERMNAEQHVKSVYSEDQHAILEVVLPGDMTPKEAATAWVNSYQEHARDTMFDENEEAYDLWVDDADAAIAIYEAAITDAVDQRTTYTVCIEHSMRPTADEYDSRQLAEEAMSEMSETGTPCTARKIVEQFDGSIKTYDMYTGEEIEVEN